MISTASIQGPRYSQEDKLAVIPQEDGLLLAVMDGHGGVDVAKYAVTYLKAIWGAAWFREPDAEAALRQTVSDLVFATRYSDAGSTLSMVFIPKGEKVAHVAVLGDSPVVVCQPNGNLHIGPDHNVRTNSTEHDAALARGAVVYQGYMYDSYDGEGLQMTRALGDYALDRVIDRNPEIYSVPLGKFVLLATDGLFDPEHKTSVQVQAMKFLDLIDKGKDATSLVHSIEQPRDNVTAVLWTRTPVSVAVRAGRMLSGNGPLHFATI